MGKPELPAIWESERHRPDASEVYRLSADNTKVKELVGWSPKHTLTEGLAETIHWVEENLERFRSSVYTV